MVEKIISLFHHGEFDCFMVSFLHTKIIMFHGGNDHLVLKQYLVHLTVLSLHNFQFLNRLRRMWIDNQLLGKFMKLSIQNPNINYGKLC